MLYTFNVNLLVPMGHRYKIETITTKAINNDEAMKNAFYKVATTFRSIDTSKIEIKSVEAISDTYRVGTKVQINDSIVKDAFMKIVVKEYGEANIIKTLSRKSGVVTSFGVDAEMGDYCRISLDGLSKSTELVLSVRSFDIIQN